MTGSINMDRIITKVHDLCREANIKTKEEHVVKFCELSIERHQHLIDKMDFDEELRIKSIIPVTPTSILADNTWFSQLCQEFKIETQHLTIIQNNVWVTQGNKAMPLTKLLSKKRDQLFTSRNRWHAELEDPASFRDDFGRFSADKFLCFLGEVTNIDRQAVVSVNPADYLRQAFSPNHAAFTTCHNLRTGGYRYGPIAYAIDKGHLMNYLCKPDTEKILARVMMYISDDMNIVAQRRFYLREEIFGKNRGKVLREMVHKQLGTKFNDNKDNSVRFAARGGLGYIDGVTVLTYAEPITFHDVEMHDEQYCFYCGKIHTKKQMYCSICIKEVGY